LFNITPVLAPYSGDTGKITISHTKKFVEAEVYQVLLPAGLVERVNNFGTWSFTVGKPDPMGAIYAPERDKPNVDLDAEVSVTYNNRNQLWTSIDSIEFAKIQIMDGETVLADVVPNVVDNKLIISHPDFEEGKLYTVVVPQYAVGNLNRLSWSFSTPGYDDGAATREELDENTLVVYPNPTSDVINIVSPNAVKRIEIFNLQGQLVKLIERAEAQVSVETLPQGAYVLKVTTDKGTVSKRIVKQ
jgi:hypothetical protein